MPKSGFVAIIGRPNSGKSTLINQVLGTRLSIVTPKAQTTRERVLGILTEERGQIVFVDTPGIHKANEGGLNESMVNEAREALEAPTLVWYLVDPSSKPKFEEPVLAMLERSKAPVIVLLNKADLQGRKIPPEVYDELESAIGAALRQREVPLIGVRRISAKGNRGVSDLLRETWERMPEGPQFFPPDDSGEEPLSDRPVRFFVGERIREQLLMKLGEEVPYSCAVEIERFDEKVRPPRIEAVIHVERDSQKGMVVGKGGRKIKEIGTAARKDIEQFLGYPVFLGLRVKVLKEWTKDAATLKRLGYNLPRKSS